MAQPRVNAVLDYDRAHLAQASADALSDRELLGRFSADLDESAFAALVRRHGSLVLGVCRRVLGPGPDAEDAFQAAFLILAKKAASLTGHESVGPWLYEVPHRLARELRRRQLRRKAREAQARPRQAEDPLADVSARELVAVLDDELAGLPEPYRGPLLLCCLEGHSGDEAARQPGCSLSTLKRRLRHGREMLQRQLERRGFTLPAAALFALLLRNAASASVPAELAVPTARAAVLIGAGQPLTAGLVSTPAVELAGGLAASLGWTKLHITLAALLALGLAAGAAVLARPGPRDRAPA